MKTQDKTNRPNETLNATTNLYRKDYHSYTTLTPKNMKFNEIAKSARLEKRLSLRQFCQETGLDPSNWSKIERGVNPPPRDPEAMERIADHLGLYGASRREFFDSADVSRSEIPHDILSDEDLVRKLPAFFRAMRDQMTPESAQLLVSDIRKINTPSPQHRAN